MPENMQGLTREELRDLCEDEATLIDCSNCGGEGCQVCKGAGQLLLSRVAEKELHRRNHIERRRHSMPYPGPWDDDARLVEDDQRRVDLLIKHFSGHYVGIQIALNNHKREK